MNTDAQIRIRNLYRITYLVPRVYRRRFGRCGTYANMAQVVR